ncbi:MAG: permease-like cell division protein FtsX [Erysipelotrichaceae bacterium]|nr:permease-like cell division protein FtsX [Erysipelotrichaceae bacterium]MBR5754578.1 permease-like cell division protein FtsX [Erysipelotrichaceae bacterium]
MMKYLRRLGRHIKEGFIGVKRHFAMAFSSASAITITLLLVGAFAAFAANLALLTQEIEQSISLVALVDYGVNDQASINSINSQIQNIENVETVEFRTKDEEFDFYNQNYPEMVEFSELYREDNPFHDAFIIYLKDGIVLEETKNKIASIPGISSVEDGGANTYTLINILHAVRNVGGIIILALVALAIYLIYNTIKITIAARKDEIWIMRNVGARNGYIRAPFLVEGIIIGIIGALVPIALIVFGYYKLYEYSSGNIAGIINLIPVMPFVLYLGLALLLIGVIVGFIGSYISVCRYLRVTR